ncbi:MAG TPA: UDP-N-acetylmuramoyl-L-alanyl-D-glutamate--2,6-diaminopimelate ligase [Miltoncostaeaceae bacterium]|nr:UDP-N-acetylmuramoyl-L-alanyl-D-glutamate--2,6-diaminopimelate ligase [Miltoncostaeaceae bacterium]
MILTDLIAGIPGARPLDPAVGATPVTALTQHADRVAPGAVVCAVPGTRHDGHDFVPAAVAAGAGAVLVERELPDPGVPQVLVPDARLALALAAARWFGDPARSLNVVGITGTNGKTTCAFLIAAMLAAAGRPCGLIGTIETRVGGRARPAERTTPDPLAVQALLDQMRRAGDRACAMEVSSHALVQRRVAGVPFAAALFTNLSRDHLDYHGDFDDYFAAKRRLFLPDPAAGVDVAPPGATNLDDEYGRRLADECGALGYAIDHPAPVRPTRIVDLTDGIRATVATPRGPLEVRSPLRGRFNLENLLGAVAVGELLGVAHDAVAAGLAAVAGVPGRFEAVDAGQPFPLIVDYAHTPDSLRNVLVTARELVRGGRLIVVVGCGGDRDRGKRPQMAAVAVACADLAVFTSDNPRGEDPEAIIADMLAGIDSSRDDHRVQIDRRAAIAHAIGLAGAGDVVVVAGKGHEQGQERSGVVTPFDDRAVAREIVAGR